MQSKTIFRFAFLGVLLGTSLASPVYAQKDSRRTGAAKEDRSAQSSKSNKDSRGGSGTNKSDGRSDSKARKERR